MNTPTTAPDSPSLLRRLTHTFGWTRHSYFLMSAFLLTLAVIGYVWWPLAEAYLSLYNPNYPWYIQVDWLLIFDFAVMSLLLMAGADLKADLPMVFVGFLGGLVIESWGTQTELWTYYTLERPPLWIIPAWPIASLSIDRLFRLLNLIVPDRESHIYRLAYWPVFGSFMALMLYFVWPTLDKSFTIIALLLCGLLIATVKDQHRGMLLTFVAGAGLGYFLELWGTTRLCWTYYTLEQPPVFAVLAHGMAAVAFWRSKELMLQVGGALLRQVGLMEPTAETPGD